MSNMFLRSIDILSLHGFLRSIEEDFAGRLRNGVRIEQICTTKCQ
jgi:hypothetical protein